MQGEWGRLCLPVKGCDGPEVMTAAELDEGTFSAVWVVLKRRGLVGTDEFGDYFREVETGTRPDFN